MKEIIIDKINEIIYEKTLDCGLKVYIWSYKLSKEVSMSLTVKYGSIHTDFKVGDKEYHLPRGIAHFLEHIKFNENKDETAHEYYVKNGSYVNAYTTYDHTSYEVNASEHILDNLNHLLYFVLNPYFTKALTNKEKGIIIEETKMTLDNPYNIGYQKLMQNLYIKNKKRNLVTGNVEDVKKITMEDSLTVFNNFYHPENMFLCVCGNVNPFEIEKTIDTFFKDKDYPKYVKPELLNDKEPFKVTKKEEIIDANVTKEKLFMGFKYDKKEFKKYDDMYIRLYISGILSSNFGTISDFNEYLIQNNLVDDLYYSVEVDDDIVSILFESSTTYPKKVAEKLTDKMKSLELLEKTFIRKIKVMKAKTILGFDDPNAVNNRIRQDIIKYDKIIDNDSEILNKLKYNESQKIIELLKNFKETKVVLNPTLKKD